MIILSTGCSTVENKQYIYSKYSFQSLDNFTENNFTHDMSLKKAVESNIIVYGIARDCKNYFQRT